MPSKFRKNIFTIFIINIFDRVISVNCGSMTDEKNLTETFLMETQPVCPHKLPICNQELICAPKINLKGKEIVSKPSNRKEKYVK